MSKYDEIIEKAIEQKKKAYNPLSKFAVGSALLTKSGKIFVGCNIEIAGYSSSLCAERVAVAGAIANGEKEFEAIAICGDSDFCYPCGVCRQVLVEFNPNIKVFIVKNKKEYIKTTAKELLPYYFTEINLK